MDAIVGCCQISRPLHNWSIGSITAAVRSIDAVKDSARRSSIASSNARASLRVDGVAGMTRAASMILTSVAPRRVMRPSVCIDPG